MIGGNVSGGEAGFDMVNKAAQNERDEHGDGIPRRTGRWIGGRGLSSRPCLLYKVDDDERMTQPPLVCKLIKYSSREAGADLLSLVIELP